VVLYLCGAYRVSERHACEVVLLPRATHRYQSIRDPLTELRLRMRALALARIRYGYRKIRVLLIREGWQVGKKLVYRLYREEGLGLRARPKARRSVSEHSRQKPRAERPNHVWSLDFVADQFTDGRRFRALTVVDVYTRECLAIEVGQSLKGYDVVRVLQQISQQRGAPQVLFCDNGSEFTSQVMDLWAYHNAVKIDFSRPGKPTDNAYVESFNGTLRAECLDAHWFTDPTEAAQLIEAWRHEYNESRPHRALGERTPNEFARQIAASRDLSCPTIAGD
jgi:putative transposase